MSKELDEVLLEMRKRDLIAETFIALGASHEQADLAADTKRIAEKFGWNGATLTFQGQPLYARDNGAIVKEFVIANKFDFLLPKPEGDLAAPSIDPAVLAAARNGNITAKGKVFQAVGEDHDKLAAVLADTSTSVDDVATKAAAAAATNISTNPWSAEAWSPSRQVSIVKSLGVVKASELAAAAKSFVGATKPNSVNLTSYRRAG